MSSSPIVPRHQQFVPHDIQIKNGMLYIGSRQFRLRCGDQVITQAEMLERVRKLLEGHYSQDQLDKAFTQAVSQDSEKSAKIKIQFSDDGARVVAAGSRGHKLSSSNNQKYQTKLTKLRKDITSHLELVSKMEKELLAKGYTKEEISAAVHGLLQEGHLSMMTFLDGKAPSYWGEKTLADLLHEPGNENLRTALLSFRSPQDTDSSSSRQAKCNKELTVFVLNNLYRSPHVVKTEDGGIFRQHFVKGKATLHTSHADSKVLFSQNAGWPSESDKSKYRRSIEPYNTNLGAIVQRSQNNESTRVVMIRSGKSDNLERLKENVVEAAFEQLACSEQAGFTPVEYDQPVRVGDQEFDRAYEFQHVITSYLDPSLVKALPERAKALWKSPEDESRYLQQVLTALDSWPPEGYQVIVDNKLIILKKPILCNQLFSTTVRKVGIGNTAIASMGKSTSSHINFIAHGRLTTRYFEMNRPCSEELLTASSELNTRLQRALKSTDSFLGPNGMIDFEKVPVVQLSKNKAFFQSREFAQFKNVLFKELVERIQEDENDLKSRALFAVLFDRTPPKQSNMTIDTREMHAADFELWKNLLCNQLNLSSAVQCKSGTDRTGAGVALAVAQARFQTTQGTPFIPDEMDEKELLLFKKYFREALRELGIGVVIETKGYSGIKWGGGVPILGGVANPVAYKYFYLQEDLDPLKQMKIEAHPKADVEGLSRHDLSLKGRAQYKGKIVDPQGLYGKSDPKTAKRLRKALKKLNYVEAGKAVQQVENFLKNDDGLGIAELAGFKVFGSTLQLEVHVRKMHLASTSPRDPSKTRLEILEQRMQNLDDNHHKSESELLELYLLDQIRTLWLARRDAKQTHLFK